MTSAPSASGKPRILTGDTPTGRLHLGHWVGSVERRVSLQDKYDCYFLLANMHAFTTRFDKPQDIRQDTIEIVKDWLAAGIDPQRATIVTRAHGEFGNRALFDAATPVLPGLERAPAFVF